MFTIALIGKCKLSNELCRNSDKEGKSVSQKRIYKHFTRAMMPIEAVKEGQKTHN